MARRTKKSGKGIAFILVAVVVVICIVLYRQTDDLRDELSQKKFELARINGRIEEERQRTEDINNEIIYRQTDDYIEDEARGLGLYYEDEIIIKPEE